MIRKLADLTAMKAEEMHEVTDWVLSMLELFGTQSINKQLGMSAYKKEKVNEAFWILATYHYKMGVSKLLPKQGNLKHHRGASH